MKLTEHAIDRGRERLSLTSDALEKLAVRAWESGIRHKAAKGRLKKYLGTLFKDGLTPVVYGEVIFMFTRDRRAPSLVTLWQIPNEFKKYLRLCLPQAA